MSLTAVPNLDSAAVSSALRAAFGKAETSPLSPVTGGLSGARLFRLEAEGRPWLLRIDGARDVFRDPVRWHQCMHIAAEAGLAPAVRHADPDSGVTITAFVEGRPLAEGYEVPRATMICAAGDLVRRLHATPPFPPLVDYMDGMAAVIGELRTTGLIAEGALETELAGYDALDRAYRGLRPEQVSSHNDLNPRNILHDGVKLWLIDWESAFLADRYVDLASLANVMVRDVTELDLLTAAYFGRAATEAEVARLFLARQVNHVFYGVMFLSGAAAERPGARIAPEAVEADLADIHQALSEGRFELDAWEGRLAYGLARLRAAGSNLASPLFAEAVRLAR